MARTNYVDTKLSSKTVEELTGRKNIKYNSSDVAFTDDTFNPYVSNMLSSCGYNINEKNVYDNEMKNTVMDFQRNNKLTVTGSVDDNTLNKLREVSSNYTQDHIEDNSDNGSIYSDQELLDNYYADYKTIYPHYDEFFTTTNDKNARRERKNIKIVFGDGTIAKEIRDVYMHSLGVGINTNGDAIVEQYQFIARDIKEIDVKEDKDKYTGEEEKMSSAADIKYNFDALNRYINK